MIDRNGRRRLLLSSIAGVVLALAALGSAFLAAERHSPAVLPDGTGSGGGSMCSAASGPGGSAPGSCTVCLRRGCGFCGAGGGDIMQAGTCLALGAQPGAEEQPGCDPPRQLFLHGCPRWVRRQQQQELTTAVPGRTRTQAGCRRQAWPPAALYPRKPAPMCRRRGRSETCALFGPLLCPPGCRAAATPGSSWLAWWHTWRLSARGSARCPGPSTPRYTRSPCGAWPLVRACGGGGGVAAGQQGRTGCRCAVGLDLPMRPAACILCWHVPMPQRGDLDSGRRMEAARRGSILRLTAHAAARRARPGSTVLRGECRIGWVSPHLPAVPCLQAWPPPPTGSATRRWRRPSSP